MAFSGGPIGCKLSEIRIPTAPSGVWRPGMTVDEARAGMKRLVDAAGTSWQPLVSSRPYQMLGELPPHGPEHVHPKRLLDECAERFDVELAGLIVSTT